jgi:plastocyanin
MRRLASLLVIASLLAAVAATAAFAATSVSWKVGTSKTVKIKKGGTVKWIWADGAPHNVKGPGFVSKTQTGKGKTYSHRFRKKGTFKIICQVHPTSMKTVVKVS